MSNTDRHESYIFQNNYGTCYITSFLQILTCIDEFRIWAIDEKIIKAICNLTPDKMRLLTHKQFMTFESTANPKTLEDLQALNVESENVRLIEIYSITGQLVKRIKNSKTINVEDLSSGVHLIIVHNDKGIYSSRFIKE